MRKTAISLLLLATSAAASPAAAQDGRQPGLNGEARPMLRRVGTAEARPPATYQPATPAPRYSLAERTVEVVGLAADIIATVQLGRWLSTHPELLPPAGAYPGPAAPVARRRPPTAPPRAPRLPAALA